MYRQNPDITEKGIHYIENEPMWWASNGPIGDIEYISSSQGLAFDPHPDDDPILNEIDQWIEDIFEEVRRDVNPDAPSRQGNIFLCPRRDRGFCVDQPYQHQVSATGKAFTTDAAGVTNAFILARLFFSRGWGDEKTISYARNYITKEAKKYWSGGNSWGHEEEIILEGTARILGKQRRRNPSKQDIINVSSLCRGDIVEWDLIPGFRVMSAPDMRWFDPIPGYEDLVMPQFRGESVYDWYVVKLGPEAIEACYALKMPVVMVTWTSPWHPIGSTSKEKVAVRIDLSGYDCEEREATLQRMLDLGKKDAVEKLDDDTYVIYVEEKTFVAFAMKSLDIFPLARYFVLASRMEHRNPSYDYGNLPPGKGWGEYDRSPRENDTYWVAPFEELDDRYKEVIIEDRFIEVKAPDAGSIKTGEVDETRDLEWLD